MHAALRTGIKTFAVAELGLLATGTMLVAADAKPLAAGRMDLSGVDEEQARSIAEELLTRVDWSAPTIVIWMPGVNAPVGIRDTFQDALGEVTSRYWIGALEYPRAANMDDDVPVAARALELVLEEISRRDPHGTRYRVSVGGESLGAWVTSEVLRRPSGDRIDRAAFFGVSGPGVDMPQHAEERTYNLRNRWDAATMPYIGHRDLWAGAGNLTFGGGASNLPAAALHVLLNPLQTITATVTTLPLIWGGDTAYANHPHNYWREMPDAARYLIDEP